MAIDKYIGKAITAIEPDATYRITGASLDNIEWLNGTSPISTSAIQTKADELKAADDAAAAQKATDKANAKAKLIAGEPLTEDEANTIVL